MVGCACRALAGALVVAVACVQRATERDEVHYVAPPPGFNPLNVTNAALAKCGFPLRPSDPSELAARKDLVRRCKHFAVPVIVQGRQHIG